MKKVSITESETLSNKSFVIKSEEKQYSTVHDEHSGDWVLFSHNDDAPTEEWFLNKESAIKKALQYLDILENPDIDRAPDRTSA